MSRLPARGAYDRPTIDAILDEGFVAHVAVADDDGQPFCIPTLYARVDDEVWIHGSSASPTLRRLQAGRPACITVTLLDGLVLARSVFNHSVNYRSVVVLGRARDIHEPEQKLRALETLTDKLVAGRWAEARLPTPQELKASTILALPLGEASAKVRSGPPGDEDADLQLPVWAGVIPVIPLRRGVPVPAPDLDPVIALPAYLDGNGGGALR